MGDEYEEMDNSKRQARNRNEKKRRDLFNTLLSELNEMIGPKDKKMDKSSVLMTTISFLKNHNEMVERSRMHEIHKDFKPAFLSNEEFTRLIFEALEGFLFVFSDTGRICYASEGITASLGHAPADIVDLQVRELISVDDHLQLVDIISNCKEGQDFRFTLNFKKRYADLPDLCTYALVQLAGFTQIIDEFDEMTKENKDRILFVCTGRMCNPQLVREITLYDSSRREFTSRHNLEWNFVFLDDRAPSIIGYMSIEVLGTSGYNYYHFDDLDKVSECHRIVLETGASSSCFHRFLTKGQQWLWLQTCFYITYNQWSSKPEFVVCNHRVMSFADVSSYFKKKEYENEQCMEEEANINIRNNAANISNNILGIPNNMFNIACNMADTSNNIAAVPNDMDDLVCPNMVPNIPPPVNIMTPPAPFNKLTYPDLSKNITPPAPNSISPPSNMPSSIPNIADKPKDEAHSNAMMYVKNMPTRNSVLMLNAIKQNAGRVPNMAGLGSGRVPNVISIISGPGSSIQSSVNLGNMTIDCPNGVSNIVHPHVEQTCEYSPMPLFRSSPQFRMNSLISNCGGPWVNSIDTVPLVESPQVFPNGTNVSHGNNHTQHNNRIEYHVSSATTPQANVPDGGQPNLEDKLQRKHEQLQQLIVRQQEELRQVKEQLLLARLGIKTSNSPTQEQQQQHQQQQQQVHQQQQQVHQQQQQEIHPQHQQQLEQFQQQHQYYQTMPESNIQQNYPPTSSNQHYMP